MAFFDTKKIKFLPRPIPDVPSYTPPIVPTPTPTEGGSTPIIPVTDLSSDTNIILYIVKDDNNSMYKKLENPYNMIGAFKEDINILEPTFTIESDYDLTQYNYIFISKFNRYYYANITLLKGRIYEFNCKVDVLMSFKNDILYIPCIIDKEEQHNNLYLNDGTFVQGNKNYTTVINYNNGFNDTSENILICCGGV